MPGCGGARWLHEPEGRSVSTLAQQALGLGRRPALLVIDATRGFTDPASPLGCDASDAMANIVRLQAAFRTRDLPIVYTINAYARASEASVFREKLPVLNELRVDGPWAALHDALRPLAGELQLRKAVPSAFFDSPLRAWLQERAVDSAVVCGFSTSGCVRASAVDALQCNLRVTVVADACADRDIEAHAYNLRDLGLKTGDVISTQAMLHTLTRVPP